MAPGPGPFTVHLVFSVFPALWASLRVLWHVLLRLEAWRQFTSRAASVGA